MQNPALSREDGAQLLEQAFAQFNAASLKLESRYKELQSEVTTLQDRLEEKDLEVQRAQRLATLGQTAAAIAHEIRNPLGAMKLFVSLLRSEVSGRSAEEQLVSEIDRCITSLDNVVSNILQFSRGSALTFHPTNLEQLAREQCEVLQRLWGAELVLSLASSGSAYLEANEDALRQVLRNLLQNAAQAVRGKGTITLEIDGSRLNEVHLAVMDDGPGIPQQVLGTLFEPFITTKREGTGLGLALVRQIVQHHRGSIRASNRGGARFDLVLPRRQKD